MKESYNQGLAIHLGPGSCLDDPRGRGEALTGGKRSRAMSLCGVRQAGGWRERAESDIRRRFSRFFGCPFLSQPKYPDICLAMTIMILIIADRHFIRQAFGFQPT